MSKQVLHCRLCRNKIGEVRDGVATIRYKQREVEVSGGVYPYRLKIACERCKTESVFDICAKETSAGTAQEEKCADFP